MMGAEVESMLASTALPSPFVTLYVTAGFCPGFRFVTLTTDALRPLSCDDFVSIVCPPLTEASNSCPLSGRWQVEQAESSACGPPGWLAPVVQSMSSWHEPHAARDGFVYQTKNCAGLAFGFVPSWQFAQLRMSCGKTTVEK